MMTVWRRQETSGAYRLPLWWLLILVHSRPRLWPRPLCTEAVGLRCIYVWFYCVVEESLYRTRAGAILMQDRCRRDWIPIGKS